MCSIAYVVSERRIVGDECSEVTTVGDWLQLFRIIFEGC